MAVNENELTVAKVSLWNRPFILTLIANAFVILTSQLLAPTLPLYVSNIGGEASQMGLVTGTFMISAIFTRPFTGMLSRKWNKKYLLMIGILFHALAIGGYSLATEIELLLLMRVVHGFGFGFTTTYFVTMATESISNERLGEGISYIGMGESFALTFGPLLGTLFLEAWGFTGLFLSGMAVVLFTLFITVFIPRSSQTIKTASPNSLKLKLDKRTLLPSLCATLVGVSMGGITSFITLYALEKGLTQVAWFFTIVALAGVVSRLFSGRIYDQFGPSYVLIPLGLMAVIGLALLVTVQSNVQLLVAAFFYGIGYGGVFPILQTWCISLVGHHERETAVATFFNFFDIGIGLGSVVLGILAQQFQNYKIVFYAAIGAYVSFLLLYVTYKNRLPDEKERRESSEEELSSVKDQ